MIVCRVQQMNRSHEVLTVLQWNGDNKITSKHYKAGVLTAFEFAAESYENNHLMILIHDEDYRTVLKLYLTTYSYCNGSEIYAHLKCREGLKEQVIRRMTIAC